MTHLEAAGTPKTTHLKDYRPPDYRVETVNLQFDLDESRTTVKSLLTVVCNHDRCEGIHPLVLFGKDLKLLALKLDGQVLNNDRRRQEKIPGYAFERQHDRHR